ncbi:MAG: nitroreductase family deazaflavin-dependent oxidoreductase [Nakamurella sp.]
MDPHDSYWDDVLTVARQGRARLHREASVIMASELPRWLVTALRLPAVLYQYGLGGLLGQRFLRITHRGRRSGRRYATVVEVVGRNRGSAEYVVISGFGARADWLRNIEAGSPILITVGGSLFVAAHRVLDPTEAEQVFADYERRNRLVAPLIGRVLSALLGWRFDGSPHARRRLAEQLPMVAFRPAANLG